MRYLRNLLAGVVAVAVLCGWVSPVLAVLSVVQSQTLSFGPAATLTPGTLLTFDQYDPSNFGGEALVQVNVTLVIDLDTVFNFTNEHPTEDGTVISAEGTALGTFKTAPGGPVFDEMLLATTAMHGPTNIGAGGAMAGSGTLTGSNMMTIMPALAGFDGVGTYDVDVSAIIGSAVSRAGGDITFTQTNSAQMSVTVEYLNDAPESTGNNVPEPVTGLLGVMGLAMLGVATRRRAG